MGVIGVAMSVVGIWIWWPIGGLPLAGAIAIGIANWWSFGIIHNYAARSRDFWDTSPLRALNAPDCLAWVHMITFVSSAILLIWGTFESESAVWWETLLVVGAATAALSWAPSLMFWGPILAIIFVLARGCS